MRVQETVENPDRGTVKQSDTDPHPKTKQTKNVGSVQYNLIEKVVLLNVEVNSIFYKRRTKKKLL